MIRRRSTVVAFVFAALLAPSLFACNTDDGLFDRKEGPVEELGEEIDKAADEVKDAFDN